MSQQNFFRRYSFLLFATGIVIFRFLYSLTNEFWFVDQDVLQIYLIGLKSFTTGSYPYFGADLVYTHAQIPGALQGYLVSIGWYLWKIPEMPMIILNILLTSSLGLLAWYAQKRFPRIPRAFIWSYIFLLPWSVCYFTRIVNPSYVIPAAILFFIGVYEILPSLKRDILPEWICFYFLGFAIFWIFQLHMSWVLLGPYTILCFYYVARTKDIRRIGRVVVSFLAGCITTGSLLLPTLLRYGFANEQGTKVTSVVELHTEHFGIIVKLLSSFLAYGSFDVTRFIGGSTSERISFLSDQLWAAPFTVFVALIGILQAAFYFISFFLYRRADRQGKKVILLTAGSFLLFYCISLFSKVAPPGHAAVLFFPLIILYGLQIMENPLQKRWLRVVSVVTFASAIIMYCGIMVKNYPSISLYKDRDRIVRALDSNDYMIVGKRRYE
jgi:hypothetical protein